MDTLPLATLPAQVRDADPNLRNAALYQLRGDGGIVQLGDRSVTISVAQAPYPGWQVFRQAVEEVLTALAATGVISTIDRLSVKYINLLPFHANEGISDLTTLRLELGAPQVQHGTIELKTEINARGHITILGISHPATLNKPNEPPQVGLVIDVDTIKMGPINESVSQLMPLFDAAHDEEKRIFFSLLSATSLERCEPQYE